MTLDITIRNEQFTLHCSGAIFWHSRQILMIADAHLGKVSHFRKAGFAVPTNPMLKNFEKLDNVIALFQPETVCFLGDLFHSSINREWELFETWVKAQNARVILVEGNHDILNPDQYNQIGIDVVSEISDDKFLLTHHPQERENLFNFCGHIHPCIRLRGLGRQFLKTCCFFQKPNQMIMAAFGEFTGSHELMPSEFDVVYAITKDEVIKIGN
ncbi:MAG: ligase-associated DNA damage response endonuclease PdeM [Flavobacterium sp.]|nr:ligase-associated DNA damage response endonuclease PdeM [Flavobacterium sp.]